MRKTIFLNAIMLITAQLFIWSVTAFAQAGNIPAFPGAEGYGKYAAGGRGGEVYLVTNLNDSGPGSLREACDASGPRTVVFMTGGIINLRSTIHITSPFITIAGQTAPGGGICIRHGGIDWFGGPLINVATHDVVIRYLRLRRGPSNEGECIGDCLQIATTSGTPHTIIIDHCSMGWSTDEIANTWYHAEDITFQNCIFSEALYFSSHQDECDSGGPIEGHSMGPLFGDYSTRISFLRNLMAHNADRNPWCTTRNPGFTAEFQVVNNLVYNWVYFGSIFGKPNGGLTRANYVGNYLKAGPDTRTSRYEVLVKGTSSNTQLYLSGNIGHHRPGDEDPDTEWDVVGINLVDPAPETYRSMEPFEMMEVPVLSAMQAYDTVLHHAGANARIDSAGNTIMNRDPVDERIITNVVNGGPDSPGRTLGNGKSYFGLKDDPTQVGGWPAYESGQAFKDADRDGMSDFWEEKNGLDPADPDDRNGDMDGDGFTNLEEFLNQVYQGSVLSAGIPSSHVNAGWNLYPNPAGNVLNIRNTGSTVAAKVRIFDIGGRPAVSTGYDVDGHIRLDISRLCPGAYLAAITGSDRETAHMIFFKK